jgi:hypothetical protein
MGNNGCILIEMGWLMAQCGKVNDGDGRQTRRIDEEQPAFSPEGVDLTLIRWMLSISPEDRLKALQNHIQSMMRLRDGRETATDKDRAVLPILRKTLEEKKKSQET